MTNLTQEYLRSILHYDPLTGVFMWKGKRARRDMQGVVAGTIGRSGHVKICINKSLYYAHRLAWFYMTGNWPKNQIDHIDGNPASNIFTNLRDVSRSVNEQNRKKANKNSKTGFLGVSWSAERNKYVAAITSNNKVTSLGRFNTLKEACDAYLAAKRKLHEGCTL